MKNSEGIQRNPKESQGFSVILNDSQVISKDSQGLPGNSKGFSKISKGSLMVFFDSLEGSLNI